MKGPPAVRPKLVPPWYCKKVKINKIIFTLGGHTPGKLD